MSLQGSDLYADLLDKARWSHSHGRSIAHILPADIDAARLFSYGYRSHTIGAFHAARVAVEAEAKRPRGANQSSRLSQTGVLLDQLEARAVDPILADHRALVSTLFYYDQWASQVDDLLKQAITHGEDAQLEAIRSLFLQHIQRVSNGNGIYLARDLELPEQGAFIVPDLDISIAPIIYGDNHSWNAAFLARDRPGVSVHRHHQGAEIHLGYSPVKGHTVLGDCFTDVNEGYALPIPPMTDHGFLNTSGHDHVLPFVFGSLKLAGWGIFFDVEPRPGELAQWTEQPLDSEAMNQSVFLERAIRQMETGKGYSRKVLVPAHRAGSAETGGLELALTRVGNEAINLPAQHYRIVSVQSGRGKVRIGNAEADVGQHDHFGIPAGMENRLTAVGTAPLIFLDAMILPIGLEQSAP